MLNDIKTQRTIYGCASKCPFTNGVACEETAAVQLVPRRARHLVPPGVSRICAGCGPKLQALVDAGEAASREASRLKREAKARRREDKRTAKKEALEAQEQLKATMPKIHAFIAKIRDALAEVGRQRLRFAADRREALMAVRTAEAEVRASQRKLKEAQQHLTKFADGPDALEPEMPSEEEADEWGEAVTRWKDAWDKVTKSFGKKHMDRKLARELDTVLAELVKMDEQGLLPGEMGSPRTTHQGQVGV